METFKVPLSAFAGGSGGVGSTKAGHFQGYAIRWDAPVDTYPPTIAKRGAFKKTLNERGGKVRVLWQHDAGNPIGRPTKMIEDQNGLYVEFQLDLGVPAADRAALQIKSGTIDGLSIGFDPILAGEELRDGVKTRTLREVKLYEFSVVTFPAEDSARILLTPEQQARQAAERERQHKIIEVHTAAFEASDREHQVKTVAINLASLGRY